jgi:hypothetical protein
MKEVNHETISMKEANSEPFSVTFSHGGKSKKIQLVRSEDVFKLASMFQMMLLENNVPFRTIINGDNEPDSSILAH